jgi:arsenate reductase (thioredoxin)
MHRRGNRFGPRAAWRDLLRAGCGLIAMVGRPYNVLFLCNGNSARSIMAEALMNHWSRGRFKGYSAGSHPKGTVHSIALEFLDFMKIAREGARSKDWNEFAQPGAPVMDFVFTVCDRTAAEECPVWPGQPITAQWAVEDPAIVQGTKADKWAAFHRAFKLLDTRIKLFLSLPVASVDRIRLQRNVDEIGVAPSTPDHSAS